MAESFTEYYVTQGSSANDLNGGGPNLGTNDGPVYSLTGGGGAGATATDNGADSNIEDLNNGSWSGVQVGDFLNFDTAGAKERARVTALSVGGDDDVITVTPQVTAAADKSCRVGGAFALPSAAVSVLLPLLSSENCMNASGHPVRINIKEESGSAYTDENILVNADATAAKNFTICGYETSAGDIDPWTSETRAKISKAAPTAARILYVGGQYMRILNLDLEVSGANKKAVEFDGSGDFALMMNCRLKSTNSHGIISSYNAAQCYFIRNVIEDCGGDGFYGRMGHSTFYLWNIIEGCTGAGLNGVGQATTGAFIGNMVVGNGGVGVSHSGNILAMIVGGNIIADNGSHGIDLGTVAAYNEISFANNIIADNGGYGINGACAAGFPQIRWFDYNCLHGNTSGAINLPNVNYRAQRHGLTSEPWVETTQASRKSNGDYRITAAMKEAGCPGKLAKITSWTSDTGYADLGCLETICSGGSDGRHGRARNHNV